MAKKAILLLGGSLDQLFIIKTAHGMGLKTAVVDRNKKSPGFGISDYWRAIDFSNTKAVIKYAEDLISKGVNLKGISTMGSDVPYIIATIAKYFNWRGPTLETGKLTTNKYLMKRRLQEEGITVPKFVLVKSVEDVKKVWNLWHCQKIIIKPTDRSGSRGVRIIKEINGIKDAFENALNSSLINEVIVEEYVEGMQISTESILTKDKSSTPGFADRVYSDMESFHPNIMENGAWVPTILSRKLKRQISNFVEKAARKLGIIYGVAKGDVVLTKNNQLILIEMAARLSGGDFCESLVPLSSGVNYVEAAIKIAIGKEPNWHKLKPSKNLCVVNRYFFPKPGKLEKISGIDKLKSLPQLKKLVLFYDKEDIIPSIKSHADRVGVMVLVGKDRDEISKLIDFSYRNIKFKIDGQWVTGKPQNYSTNLLPTTL